MLRSRFHTLESLLWRTVFLPTLQSGRLVRSNTSPLPICLPNNLNWVSSENSSRTVFVDSCRVIQKVVIRNEYGVDGAGFIKVLFDDGGIRESSDREQLCIKRFARPFFQYTESRSLSVPSRTVLSIAVLFLCPDQRAIDEQVGQISSFGYLFREITVDLLLGEKWGWVLLDCGCRTYSRVRGMRGWRKNSFQWELLVLF